MIGRCRFCGGWAATDQEFIVPERRLCRCKTPNLEFGPVAKRDDVCSPPNLFMAYSGLERNAESKAIKG